MRTPINHAIDQQRERVTAAVMSCNLSGAIVLGHLDGIHGSDRLARHRVICDQIDAELTNLRKHVQSLRREMTLLERVRDKKENGITAL